MSLSKALKKRNKPFPPHLIVKARAGTGKTTTLIEGLKIMKGESSPFVPSEQQEAIWSSMSLSKDASSICFCAFNKSIATELQERVPRGCDAMTMHSLGYKSVREAFPNLKKPNNFRVQDIIAELLEKDIRDIRRTDFELLKATQRLVDLCKMNLIFPEEQDILGGLRLGFLKADEALSNLVSHYDIDLNGNQSRVFDLVPKVLERCKDVARDGCIDFSDMIWLPIVLNLSVPRYDLLLVDECQDLNRCQQTLANNVGKRLIFCGDEKQAIYGFAGADAESMERLQKELSETKQGCELLPLTVTRRCGKAIVKEAQKYVPDFEAHESCPEGRIFRLSMTSSRERGLTCKHSFDSDNVCQICGESAGYQSAVSDVGGDMILCRVNAPLISECFKFLRQGKKANIQGRDIGQGLISTINKQKATNVADLTGKLSDWLHRETEKENQKRNPSESHLIILQDRYDCITCFMEDAKTIDEVVNNINILFTDDKDGNGIKLSSVHKAKGLEADRVFILQPEGATIPHPMAKTKWQRAQEFNLLYVAITRAKEELVYVS